MITERHLRVFYEVCKHMNMTKASKELFVSQPAISKTIHDIEQDYGVKLFERWNKALYLTPEGANLYEYSKQVVNLLDTIDTNMRARNTKDLIRVGASITIGTSILSEIVSGFCAENDSVRIEALVDNTPVIEQALLQGRLDIAFVEGRLTSMDIKSEIVGSTDILLVVNRLHELYGLEPKAETTDDGIFVWVETSENSYCLFVDELLGEQQVVIKPLPSYLNGFGIKDAGIVGCTILGDGNISLILDVGNILASSTGYTGY